MARRFMGVFLLLVIATGLIISTGCGGGGGGGGLWSAIGVGVLVLAISVTAPAAVPFAASVRGDVNAEIRAASRSKTYKARIKTATKVVEVDTFDVSGDNLTLTFDDVKIEAPADGKYQVEIYSATNTVEPFMKGYFVEPVADGVEKNDGRNITTASTAAALAYETWPGKNSSNIDTFIAGADQTKITALTQKVETELLTVRDNADTTFSADVTTTATEIGAETPTPQPDATDNPNVVALPAERTTISDLSLDQVKVQAALVEALKTLDNKIRVASVRPSELLPSVDVIPVIGDNKLLNLGGMLNTLMQTLPGTPVQDLPLVSTPNNQGNHRVYYENDRLVEEYYIANVNPQTQQVTWRLQERRVTTGITVTADGEGFVTGMQTGANTQIVQQSFDDDGQTVKDTLTLNLPANLSVSATLQKTEVTPGFHPTDFFPNCEYGISYTHTVQQTLTINWPNLPMTFSFELAETGKETRDGSITITGPSGSVSETYTGYFGVNATRYNGTQIVPLAGANPGKHFTGDSLQNGISFVNNTLNISITGNAPPEGLSIEQFSINIPNIQSVGTALDPKYSFSGASGEIRIRHLGPNYSEFGYIYRLSVIISNLAFNGLTEKIPDGARVEVTKTNTDNTVDAMSYLWKNDMLNLESGSNRFGGGHETMISAANGDITVNGSVKYRNSARNQELNLVYKSTQRVADSSISGFVGISIGSTANTLFFGRTGQDNITGKFYAGAKSVNDGQGDHQDVITVNGRTLLGAQSLQIPVSELPR